MSIFRRFIAAIISLSALAGVAECQTLYSYVASTGNQSVVSSAYAATLQQPALNSLPVSFPPVPAVGAAVYCSAACVVSVILNGTAATGATTTIQGSTNSTPPAVVTLYSGSNASGGTTLYTFNVAAGQTFPLDMSAMKLPAGNATSNITLSIASGTATVNITFFPLEQH